MVCTPNIQLVGRFENLTLYYIQQKKILKHSKEQKINLMISVKYKQCCHFLFTFIKVLTNLN